MSAGCVRILRIIFRQIGGHKLDQLAPARIIFPLSCVRRVVKLFHQEITGSNLCVTITRNCSVKQGNATTVSVVHGSSYHSVKIDDRHSFGVRIN